MKLFTIKYALPSLLLLVANCCLAIEIEQGRVYPGGAYVESSQTGVGLTIPDGWQGAWPQGSEMFVFESVALKANIFMRFQAGDESGLQALMSNTIPLDPTVSLVPASAPQKSGNLYTANYTVSGAPQLSGFIAAQILPPSMGVAFIALSADATKTRQVEQTVIKLANNLTVKTPVTQAAAPPANNGGRLWKAYFKGQYIARIRSSSGFNESQELWLCSDGRFVRKAESGSFGMSGASVASQNNGQGYWAATGSTAGEGQLILQFGAGAASQISIPGEDYSTSSAGGERWVYTVSLGKELYLDGKKWLRGKNDVCG